MLFSLIYFSENIQHFQPNFISFIKNSDRNQFLEEKKNFGQKSILLAHCENFNWAKNTFYHIFSLNKSKYVKIRRNIC
jgi:hypothetical protein